MKKKILVIILFVLLPFTIRAQETSKKEQRKQTTQLQNAKPWKTQFIIGANVIMEATLADFNRHMGSNSPAGGLVFTPGISLEVGLSRHSGIETGIYYRYNNPNGLYNGRYISVPILYKFSSRIINFAAGPNFDFLIGGESPTEGYDVGALLKISKDIRLYKGLLIEPYIQTDYMFSSNKLFWGVGVGLKYRF